MLTNNKNQEHSTVNCKENEESLDKKKLSNTTNNLISKSPQIIRKELIPSVSTSTSSFTKLSDSKLRTATKDTSSGNKSNLLSVEDLFRDLELDCDEEIKKLDEIQNLHKNYNLKQGDILKSIEIKNLISIYEINKRVLKKRGSHRILLTRRHFESSIDKKKSLYKRIQGKNLIKACFKLRYMNLNGSHLLIVNKLNKITQLNPVCCATYKYKFVNKCNGLRMPFFHLFSLILNSYYLNFSLIISLQKVKFSLKKIKETKIIEREEPKKTKIKYEKKTNINTANYNANKNKIMMKPKDKYLKKAETSGKIEINLQKSLLDEYYEKYCEEESTVKASNFTPTTESTVTTRNTLKISKSIKIKRSRTEERLNEISRHQVSK